MHRRTGRGGRIGALALSAVIIVACGSDEGQVTVDSRATATTTVESTIGPPTSTTATTDVPATEPPAASAPPATVPDTVAPPVTAGPTTTTPGITVGFDPACVDTPSAGTTTDTALDDDLTTFGPLGYTPAITVNLPLGHGEDEGVVGPTQAHVARIPGGFLVGVLASSSGTFDGSIYAAIDHDGTVRWVRCFDERLSGPIVGGVDMAPTSALVSTTSFADGELAQKWHQLSLDDGALSTDVVDRAVAQGVAAELFGRELARTRDELVLGTWDDHPIDEAVDRLVRLDLHTLEATTVPYPPGSAGRSTGVVAVTAGVDDVLMATGPSQGERRSIPLAVLAGDVWSTDSALLDAAQPVTVVFDESDGPGTLYVYDSAGRTMWERPDIGTFGGEGFRTATSGDVVIVSGCEPGGDFADPCLDEGALLGLDVATGTTLWQLDGARGVGPIGDGVAIVTDAIDRSPTDGPQPVVWRMIDVSTGESIDGQEWPQPFDFGTQCCGGDEIDHTDRLDGAVVTVHGTQAFIWFPLQLTPRVPAVASIPGSPLLATGS